MPLSNPPLWKAILAYRFPDAPSSRHWWGERASQDFESLIARSCDVTEISAARMVAEYRRFLYLKAVDGGTLTPPRRVDEVWHRHIGMADDAWPRFCADVVGAPIAHEAGLSAPAAVTAYARTVHLYRGEFGLTPPRDIWPGRAETWRRAVGIWLGLPGLGLSLGGHLLAIAVAFLPGIFPAWLSASGTPFWMPYTFYGGLALVAVAAWITSGTDVERPVTA